MGFQKADKEPRSIDLNKELFTKLSMKLTFYYNCLSSTTWFCKLSPFQNHTLLNCSFACSLATLDILSYRLVRDLQRFSAVPNMFAPRPTVLYSSNLFVHALHAFHSLADGFSESQGVDSGTTVLGLVFDSVSKVLQSVVGGEL